MPCYDRDFGKSRRIFDACIIATHRKFETRQKKGGTKFLSECCSLESMAQSCSEERCQPKKYAENFMITRYRARWNKIVGWKGWHAAVLGVHKAKSIITSNMITLSERECHKPKKCSCQFYGATFYPTLTITLEIPFFRKYFCSSTSEKKNYTQTEKKISK